MSIESIGGQDLDPAQSWEHEIILVMPATDLEMASRCAELMEKRAGCEVMILIVHDSNAEGFVSLSNRMFSQTRSALFGYLAQDAFPGRLWLRIAKQAMAQENAGLFAFNDGKWQGMLASFGLVRREWAMGNYAGNLFFTAYQRHYADVELTLLAMAKKAYRHDPRSVLVEVDWEKDRKPVHQDDKQLFRARSAHGFEGRVKDTALLNLFS